LTPPTSYCVAADVIVLYGAIWTSFTVPLSSARDPFPSTYKQEVKYCPPLPNEHIPLFDLVTQTPRRCCTSIAADLRVAMHPMRLPVALVRCSRFFQAVTDPQWFAIPTFTPGGPGRDVDSRSTSFRGFVPFCPCISSSSLNLLPSMRQPLCPFDNVIA